ncbi:zeaxanthin epoxidase, chloroplastic [Canna indica]|uniref:Zeaxanthin epoxidase, chloroplastic n=1 Tax=Canna indica TaxID=4628 RepID=A0AAQ3Q4E7_9LILI|nr:zeaxanthin epoxidase, chloroplastic [Canna indica]
MDVAEEVMKAGCITGDRINGLVDGISGNWYVKFDTFTPAAERGLPVTRVISRMTLQQILARAVGDDIILNDSNVIDFVDNGDKVTVKLENGQQLDGDFLVGADGIWVVNYKLDPKMLLIQVIPATLVLQILFLQTLKLLGKKERLLKIFDGWCDNVIDLLHATDEEAILRRDIYDRIPVMSWEKVV